MKRLAALMVALGALLLGVNTVAEAYPPTGPTLEIIGEQVPGGIVTVQINNCNPGDTIEVFFNGELIATLTCVAVGSGGAFLLESVLGAPSTGQASTPLQLPTEPGTYPGEARIIEPNITLPFTIVLEGDDDVAGGGGTNGDDNGDGTLPATGSSGLSTTTTIAIGLLVVGGVLFLVAMRRREQPEPAT